ncbi:MAG TPA: PRC-barrel domain-containing protein [Candidatus Eisenbacteria bacterium]|nr:PRC-barrel domain-containing protein [Candidatus Eisenbacteria bacterium]
MLTTMLRSVRDLYGYRLTGTDGDLGHVHEFYFDDEFWMIRYLVADTGSWLTGRRVLVSPSAFDEPEWEKRVFPVRLSRQEIEEGPEIEADEPVSRQHEEALSEYFQWAPYWLPGGWAQPVGGAPPSPVRHRGPKGDPHLRSTRDVIGYHLKAADGPIGHVDDFIINDADWAVRYLVVDTRNWLPGKKVLISPWWVQDIRWEDSRICVSLTCEQIRRSPPYDFASPVGRDYEDTLFEHYGKPKYWV